MSSYKKQKKYNKEYVISEREYNSKPVFKSPKSISSGEVALKDMGKHEPDNQDLADVSEYAEEKCRHLKMADGKCFYCGEDA